MRYHERTKHRFDRYARRPGDSSIGRTSPNPFRRFEGAPLIRLPLLGAGRGAAVARYDDLYRRGSVPSADAHDPRAFAPASVRAGALGLEASGRHALGAALQPVERQPASRPRATC